MAKRWLTAVLVFILLAAGMQLQGTASAESGSLDQWTVKSPIPIGGRVNDVRFVNDTLILLGEYQMSVSADGVNWSRGTAPNGRNVIGMNSVAYGDGTYVAVGTYGNTLSSTDGVNWTYGSVGGNVTLYDVAYSNNRFIATAGIAGLYISDDKGKTWTPQNSSGFFPNLATNGSGTLVLAGGMGRIMSSEDNGNTWTNRTSNTSNDIRGMFYVNGRFIGVTAPGYQNGIIINAAIVSSADGINWSSADSGTDKYIFGIDYDKVNKKYVAVGNEGAIITSSDLNNWTPVTGHTQNFSSVVYAFDKFHAAGGEGVYLTSADGAVWENSFKVSAKSIFNTANAGGTAVAVGEGLIFTSEDGELWADRTPSDISTYLGLRGISYGNGTLVVVGDQGTILTSADQGSKWDKYDWGQDVYHTFYNVSYGDGAFVAVGDSGKVAVSLDDGASWTLTELETQGDTLRGIGYGNGVFIAVSQYGKVFASDNRGATWTEKTSYQNKQLFDVAFHDGTFVIVGQGMILSSDDNGENWSSVAPTDFNQYTTLFGVDYGNGYFIAAGYSDTILTSEDGTTWMARSTGSGANFYSASFWNDRFILTGSSGAIVLSDNVVPPVPPVTYTIAAIADQSLAPLTVGYPSGTQESGTVTVTRTGTGDLVNLAAALSGDQAGNFEITQPAATTLTEGAPTTAFTVKAKEGLAVGTYTTTITLSADNMEDVTFTVTQTVYPLKGDINGDGKVTPADALYVTKYVQGKIELTDEQKQTLDVNGDNVVNADDAKMLLQMYVGGK